eukprot:11426343-Karenia_brevis.AAC.1
MPRRDRQRHRDWGYDDEAQAMASATRTTAPTSHPSQPSSQQQQRIPKSPPFEATGHVAA